jgi:hypothetical protein
MKLTWERWLEAAECGSDCCESCNCIQQRQKKMKLTLVQNDTCDSIQSIRFSQIITNVHVLHNASVAFYQYWITEHGSFRMRLRLFNFACHKIIDTSYAENKSIKFSSFETNTFESLKHNSGCRTMYIWSPTVLSL